MPDEDLRLQLLNQWLERQLPALFAAQDWGSVPAAGLTPASSDASASFRRPDNIDCTCRPLEPRLVAF